MGPSNIGTSSLASKSAGTFIWGHEACIMGHFSGWKKMCCLKGLLFWVQLFQREKLKKRQWPRKKMKSWCGYFYLQSMLAANLQYTLSTNKTHLGRVCWQYQLSWWFVWYTSRIYTFLWYFEQNNHQAQHQIIVEHWILCDVYHLHSVSFTTPKSDFWTGKEAAEIVQACASRQTAPTERKVLQK